MSCFGENRFHPGFNFVLLSAAYAATATTTMNPKSVKSLDFLENIAEEPPSHRRSLYIKDRESELSRMQTLVELLPEIKRLGNREAVRWSNGFRTWVASYSDLYRTIATVVEYFDQVKIRKGNRVLIWADNRIEWVAVFWACIARGIEAVPVDIRFSPELV